MEYDADLEHKISIIQERLVQKESTVLSILVGCAIKLLENDNEIKEKYPILLSDIVNHDEDTQIINQKYDFIQAIIHEVVLGKTSKEELTDKIDACSYTSRYGAL